MGLIDDLLDLQVPTGLEVSPKGDQVVYSTALINAVKKGEHAVSTLWLATVGAQHSARQITSGEHNDASPAWHPDGKSIAFISDRGKKGESSAIYLMPIDVAGEPHALTASDNEQSIEEFRLSPDGQFIAYLSKDEKSSEKKQREDAKDDVHVWGENLEYSRLRIVHVSTKKTTTLFEQPTQVCGLAWSPDSKRIAMLSTKDTQIDSQFLHGCDISIVDLVTREVTKVAHFQSAALNPIWTGNTLYFMAVTSLRFFISSNAVWSLDLETDTKDFRRRAHGEVDCVNSIRQARDGVVVCVEQGMDTILHFLDGKEIHGPSTGIDPLSISQPWDVRCSNHSGEPIIAFTHSSVGRPIEVFSKSTSSAVPVQLSNHGASVKGYTFGSAQTFSCQSADDTVRLDAVYFSPAEPRDGRKPYATLVMVHGGPYGRDIDCFTTDSRYWLPTLLNAGYGVLCPNYRGSSGRGDAFAAHARGACGTVDYDDVISLTQHAVQTGLADADNLVLGGWSQGGFMAYVAAVRNGMHGHGWRFRAVVAGAGLCDQDTMCFASDLGASYEPEFAGGAPWRLDEDDWPNRRGSAIWSFARAARAGLIPPVLILHGEKDVRVPIEQAVAFRRALADWKLPFEYVTYPREGHSIREYKHLRDVNQRLMRWMDLHCRK